VVAKEQERQLGGSVSNDDIAELGRDAGAQYVCVVERAEADGRSYVTTSMVSVQTKIAELSDISELPRGGRIINLIERQINSMLGIAQPEPEPEIVAVPVAAPAPVVVFVPAAPAPVAVAAPATAPASVAVAAPAALPAPVAVPAPSNPAQPTGLGSVYLSFYKPNITSFYDYEDQELSRDGLNVMLGFEGISGSSLFGGSFFFGGGKLGGDIREFIVGFDVKKLLWFWEKVIAIPISIGLEYRYQWTDIENRLVATFIDEPKFLQEPDDYLDKKRTMTRHNFDIVPSIDLQIFIGDNFSIYAGYMYRTTPFFNNWEITYKIPGKDYKDKNGSEKDGDEFAVPEGFNPLKNSKEQIFGKPGTLRFGVKFH
jgi:hypothetical protein